MFSLAKIPSLNKLAIQNYVGLSSFHKGEGYAINRAIRQGKLKNHLLTAVCQGHEFDPYRVEVIFNSEGIQQSYCSCPVGAEGKCKHIAALLLTWIETPEIFVEWENLKENLQSYDASALLELIDLLEDKIEDSSEVIRAFGENLQRMKSPRLAKYIRRIDEAFHVSELPWYHPDKSGLNEIAFALDKIRSDVDQLIENGQVEEAIRINQNLIQQILNHWDVYLNFENSLSEELKGCIRSLNEAFQHLKEKKNLRQKIFHILFRLIEEQLYREDDVGAEEAKQVILQHIFPEERNKIVSWVEALQICRSSVNEQKYLKLEDFLIDLQRDLLEPEIYLEHYRHTGQELKLVDSLLALNRTKEAQVIVQQRNFDFQTLHLVNLFIKHDQGSIAEKLVLDLSKKHSDLSILSWLKNYYEQQGNFQFALEFAKKIFYLSPQFDHYQMVQNLAQKLNQWPFLRQEIIQYFEEIPDELLLVEIYLEEQALKEAIEAFERISKASYYSFKNTRYTLLALYLAETIRVKYPLASLQIYQGVVNHLITERSRESYRRACDYLKIIKAIFEDLHQIEEWKVYLASLMKSYSRLKAFKAELHSAGLF